MRIEERIVGDVTVLIAEGKMTLAEGDELLKTAIEGLIARDRRLVVLDLGGVPYVDSSGFGEIYRSMTKLLRVGGNLVFCNVTKRIEDLMVITKMISISEIYHDVEEAVERFRSGRFEVACPICRPRRWQTFRGSAGCTTCDACDVEFAFSSPLLTDAFKDGSEPEAGWTLRVQSLSWYPYSREGESRDTVRLQPGHPPLITVSGRLDLFTLDAIEAARRAVPAPYAVLIDTTPVTASSPAAWEKLLAICGSPERERTLVLGSSVLAATVSASESGGAVTVDRDLALARIRDWGRGEFGVTTTVRRRSL